MQVIGCGTLIASQMSKVSHGLYGFAKAGFICQDAVEFFAMETCQPLYPDLLVVPQRAMQKCRRREMTLRSKRSVSHETTRHSDWV